MSYDAHLLPQSNTQNKKTYPFIFCYFFFSFSNCSSFSLFGTVELDRVASLGQYLLIISHVQCFDFSESVKGTWLISP